MNTFLFAIVGILLGTLALACVAGIAIGMFVLLEKLRHAQPPEPPVKPNSTSQQREPRLTEEQIEKMMFHKRD